MLGQIPNNIALQKLAPRVYFPSCMLAWGLITLGTGFTKHPWQIMVLRFFQAAIESSTFVGCHYILGSWYKEDELGKRTAIFTSSGLAGTMFSGFLQGGVYSSLGKAVIFRLFSVLDLGADNFQTAPRVFLAGGGCSSLTFASPCPWPSLDSGRSQIPQRRHMHGGSARKRRSSPSTDFLKSRKIGECLGGI